MHSYNNVFVDAFIREEEIVALAFDNGRLGVDYLECMRLKYSMYNDIDV